MPQRKGQQDALKASPHEELGPGMGMLRGSLNQLIARQAQKMGMTVQELMNHPTIGMAPHDPRNMNEMFEGGGAGRSLAKLVHLLGLHPDDFSNMPGSADQSTGGVGRAPGELPLDVKRKKK